MALRDKNLAQQATFEAPTAPLSEQPPIEDVQPIQQTVAQPIQEVAPVQESIPQPIQEAPTAPKSTTTVSQETQVLPTSIVEWKNQGSNISDLESMIESKYNTVASSEN